MIDGLGGRPVGGCRSAATCRAYMAAGPLTSPLAFLTLPVCVLLQMSGSFKLDGSGNVELKELDGIDYAPVTVQLPGGERVPFLFTVKELDAKV